MLLQRCLKVVFVYAVYTVLHAVVVLMWISYSAPVRARKSTINPREVLCNVSLCTHVLSLSIDCDFKLLTQFCHKSDATLDQILSV